MEMRSEEAEETMQQQQVQVPPVLEEKKKKRVMVALDEHEGSFYALKWALNNLFTTCDHGLSVDQQDVGIMIIVHVQLPFQHYIYPGPAGPAVYGNTSVMESVKKAQEHNSAIPLSRAVQICEEKPVSVKLVMVIIVEVQVTYGVLHSMNDVNPQSLSRRLNVCCVSA
ncbi:hypothetical protein IFM89_025940 [Coptis chinensis]|uniref:UspA domain-containing protein n=1 Tax=Coptis chinensis TaxID=261450 RepID=A0A835LP51_9MAGN|nr:hypothetical protein IFM89_025940 [Coptis chinensis]